MRLPPDVLIEIAWHVCNLGGRRRASDGRDGAGNDTAPQAPGDYDQRVAVKMQVAGTFLAYLRIPPREYFDNFMPPSRHNVTYERRHGDGHADGDMRALCLVSPELHVYLRQFLYAHVVITKPSTLYLFARSILENPSLRTHVNSLWVGDKTPHPSPQWPLTHDRWPAAAASDNNNGLRASLDAKMPSGVPPGTPWLLTAKYGNLFIDDEAVILAAGTRRIYRVIRSFCNNVFHSRQILCLQRGKEGCTKYFDDDIEAISDPIFLADHQYSEQLEEEGSIIEVPKALWTIKLYHVQAYLDSYMEVLHKWERENGSSWRRDGLNTWYRTSMMQQSYFNQECGENLKPPRDRFDDPVLYARAGAFPFCCGDPEDDPPREKHSSLYQEDKPDDDEDFDFLRTFKREPEAYWAWWQDQPHIHGVITALHMLLKRLPNLKDLHLRGSLERAQKGEFIVPGRLDKSALPVRGGTYPRQQG